MSRLTLEYDPGTHRFRFLLERDAHIVAARQIDLPRMAKRLLARLAFVAALILMATHPLPYRHVWQPVAARGDMAAMSAELAMPAEEAPSSTLVSLPVAYHGAAKGVLPAYASVQPDAHPVPTVTNLPTPPDAPGLELWVYQAAGGETMARIAAANAVSLGCLAALNPGVTLAADAKLLLPKPGCEVIVYQASGGETLSDLAAFWTPERTGAYLRSDTPGRDVTLAELVRLNGLPADASLAPGQVVYVLVNEPGGEYHCRTALGIRYVGRTMCLPVAGVQSRTYGGPEGGHRAVDIAAPLGTPIVCPRAGVVLWIGWDEDEEAMGVHVHLVHRWSEGVLAYMATRFGVADYASLTPEQRAEFASHVQAMRDRGELASMLETVYGHVGSPGFGVAIGSAVEAGSTLAYVGDNGHSTGPHVHWVGLVDEEPQDPREFVAPYGGPGE